MKLILYGPYTISKQVKVYAHCLDLLSHLGIHNMVSVSHWKLYETPLLEENVHISHTIDAILYFWPQFGRKNIA